MIMLSVCPTSLMVDTTFKLNSVTLSDRVLAIGEDAL